MRGFFVNGCLGWRGTSPGHVYSSLLPHLTASNRRHSAHQIQIKPNELQARDQSEEEGQMVMAAHQSIPAGWKRGSCKKWQPELKGTLPGQNNAVPTTRPGPLSLHATSESPTLSREGMTRISLSLRETMGLKGCACNKFDVQTYHKQMQITQHKVKQTKTRIKAQPSSSLQCPA